jgi:hypothetical protein
MDRKLERKLERAERSVLDRLKENESFSNRYKNSLQSARLRYAPESKFGDMGLRLYLIAIHYTNLEELKVFAQHGFPRNLLEGFEQALQAQPDLPEKSWSPYCKNLLADTTVFTQFMTGMHIETFPWAALISRQDVLRAFGVGGAFHHTPAEAQAGHTPHMDDVDFVWNISRKERLREFFTPDFFRRLEGTAELAHDQTSTVVRGYMLKEHRGVTFSIDLDGSNLKLKTSDIFCQVPEGASMATQQMTRILFTLPEGVGKDWVNKMF